MMEQQLAWEQHVPASGTYKPTNIVGTIGPEPDNWVAPGPGVVSQPTPTLSSFGNGNQNGDWKLFVFDDAAGDAGNWGSWSITFTDPPAVCFPINLTGQPANATVCAGANGSFTVAATPNGVSYNWQVNTGSGFVYLNKWRCLFGSNDSYIKYYGCHSCNEWLSISCCCYLFAGRLT